MTNIDKTIIEDAKAAGLFTKIVRSGFVQDYQNGLIRFAQLREARLRNSQSESLSYLVEDAIQRQVSNSPQPLRDLGIYLSTLLDEDQWTKAEEYLLKAAFTVPPQSQSVTDALEAAAGILDDWIKIANDYGAAGDDDEYKIIKDCILALIPSTQATGSESK